MAYDSKTYGQSPFGNAPKPDGSEESKPKIPTVPIDDGLDQGPGELSAAPPAISKATSAKTQIPNKPVAPNATPGDSPAAKSAIPASVTQIANRLGLGKAVETVIGGASTSADDSSPSGRSSRKSRTTATSTAKAKTTKKSTKRKSKKTKAAELAQAEVEAAEAEIARRFLEEDRSAYMSLLYKTGISGLVWAVLRLSRHELSDDAIALINILIHPILIDALSLCAVVGLTFWMRRLLVDLAYHTQQLNEDAETSEGKNYRPTLEIVGDALEYNPKLRRNLNLLFNASSILICALISYLITSALLP